jgi:c-di-GMP phosphodiesterase
LADYLLRRDVSVLAEKVETREQFSRAEQLGYQYFQGFFFAQPEMLFRKEIPGTKLHYLELLQEINHQAFDLVGLAAIVERDVSLSYKLLRYINATFFTRQREIRSLHQALVTLGERKIKQWASLVAVSMITDEKPNELLRMSIARAKFCELLEKKPLQQERVTDAFLVGMFPLLDVDVVLDMAMSAIMESVPLSQNIKDSLLGENGFERQLLDLAFFTSVLIGRILSAWRNRLD